MRLDSLVGMVDAVAAGIGVGLLLTPLAEARPELTRLQEPLPELDTQLWLLTHPGLRSVARVRALVDHLFDGLCADLRLDHFERRGATIDATASSAMNKAFTKESDGDADADDGGDLEPSPLPSGAKNYITPQGYRRLREELMTLLDAERPKVVEAVSWAAKNGDRSENGDYIYGKKRLREIDRRIRFLTRRLDIAEVADPSLHHGSDQIFFGARVTYETSKGERRTITIKGVDEADSLAGEVSWVAPIARALLKAREGDEVQLLTPGGAESVEVIEVRYPPPAATR